MRILLFVACFLLANASYANNPPHGCPNAKAIQSEGVSRNAFQDASGLWVTGRRDEAYGTHHTWTFVMYGIVASNQAQAYSRACDALPSLKYKSGPAVLDREHYACTYTTTQGFFAQTLTPNLEAV